MTTAVRDRVLKALDRAGGDGLLFDALLVAVGWADGDEAFEHFLLTLKRCGHVRLLVGRWRLTAAARTMFKPVKKPRPTPKAKARAAPKLTLVKKNERADQFGAPVNASLINDVAPVGDILAEMNAAMDLHRARLIAALNDSIAFYLGVVEVLQGQREMLTRDPH